MYVYGVIALRCVAAIGADDQDDATMIAVNCGEVREQPAASVASWRGDGEHKEVGHVRRLRTCRHP